MGEECVAGETLQSLSYPKAARERVSANVRREIKTEVRCEVVHLGVVVLHR